MSNSQLPFFSFSKKWKGELTEETFRSDNHRTNSLEYQVFQGTVCRCAASPASCVLPDVELEPSRWEGLPGREVWHSSLSQSFVYCSAGFVRC